MPKQLIAIVLLLPSIALADCGFANEDGDMTIVVGKKSNQCFSSGSFREAFKSSLVASVKAMEGDEQPSAPQKKAIDDRNARGNKLWALAERQHQATMPAARYFGQK